LLTPISKAWEPALGAIRLVLNPRAGPEGGACSRSCTEKITAAALNGTVRRFICNTIMHGQGTTLLPWRSVTLRCICRW
jgi:hypothetical protein